MANFTFTAQSTEHRITLATAKLAHYNTDTILGGFKIELINILPQKELDIPFNYEQYVAEVKITKL